MPNSTGYRTSGKRRPNLRTPSPLEKSDVLAAVDAAAARLGNTRTVCRRAYIRPSLIENLDEDAVREAWADARTPP